MKIFAVKQGTPEWLDARRGRLTASNMGAWLTKNDKTSQKARRTAAAAVLAELAGFPDPPVFENADIKPARSWGNAKPMILRTLPMKPPPKPGLRSH